MKVSKGARKVSIWTPWGLAARRSKAKTVARQPVVASLLLQHGCKLPKLVGLGNMKRCAIHRLIREVGFVELSRVPNAASGWLKQMELNECLLKPNRPRPRPTWRTPWLRVLAAEPIVSSTEATTDQGQNDDANRS
jgi:hypothetical protein